MRLNRFCSPDVARPDCVHFALARSCTAAVATGDSAGVAVAMRSPAIARGVPQLKNDLVRARQEKEQTKVRAVLVPSAKVFRKSCPQRPLRGPYWDRFFLVAPQAARRRSVRRETGS